MLEQKYDINFLRKTVTNTDVYRWNLWSDESERELVLHGITSSIKNGDYALSPLVKKKIGSKNAYDAKSSTDFFAIKMTDHYIRRIYKVKQSDRNRIIKEISSLLGDRGKLTLLRMDVKSFYENIELNKVIAKIKEDMILNSKGLTILNSIHDSLISLGCQGLPRGIGLSATLSELYMEPFDRAMRAHKSIFYYSRYVDDIIVLADEDQIDKVELQAKLKLSELSLETNDKKGIHSLGSLPIDFDYLGYNFEVARESEDRNDQKKYNNIITSIQVSPSKIKKYMTRMVKSFKSYERNHNFKDLIERLRYLSGSQIIKKSKNGNILSGLKYNYRYVTDYKCLKVLDAFLYSILDNIKYAQILTPDQRAKLIKVSFYRSSRDGYIVKYSRKRVTHLKKVWRYE